MERLVAQSCGPTSKYVYFSQFNDVYQEFFKHGAPARSCVAVDRLPKDVLVEIEAIAMV